MKYWIIFPAIFLLALTSCGTKPQVTENPGVPITQAQPEIRPQLEPTAQPQIEQPVEPVEQPVALILPPEEVIVNAFGITVEEYEAAKFDIQKFIEELNRLIRAQNYNTWLTHLSVEHRNLIASREFLNEIMEKYPAFKGKLNSARDYFTQIVVPSRSNEHVDDIEYVSETHVIAYTLNKDGQREILYQLEHIDGTWLIAPP